MRAGGILIVLAVGVVAVLVALAVTGELPGVAKHLTAVASSWTAPSDSASGDAGAPDGGPTDGGGEAAVKAQTAPLTSAQLSAPLHHVAFIAGCGAPPDMRVTIKVDVKMGRAVGALVTTDPPDPGISACIERATLDLRWPASRKLEHVTVRY